MPNLEDIPPGTPSKFVYLWIKANKYMKVSPAVYRKRDFFKMPDISWPPEMLETIRLGMEQILQFRGHSRNCPFEGLGVEGFYALLATLHFELKSLGFRDDDQNDGMLIYRMEMQHSVSGEIVVLYNRVPMPEIE